MGAARLLLCLVLLLGQAAGVAAQGVGAGAERGRVTGLPLPRYVSMKAEEGNVRRGPSLTHRIDWVYKHIHQPLKVVGEFGHWRRVQDHEGQGGWMHYSLLSGTRWVRVMEPEAPLRLKPNENAAIRARAMEGALLRLGACTRDWCEVSAQGAKGWILKAHVWGVDPDEIRD